MQSKLLKWCVAVAAAAVVVPALADSSSSSAASNVSDWFATTSGWQTNRVFYVGGAVAPAGTWDSQYQNTFAGVGTGPLAGWNTWFSANKPAAAAWKGSISSVPYPHRDTSAAGSTDENWTYVAPYTGFKILGGGFYAKKQTYSAANAKAAVDNPAVAQTQLTDPFVIAAPQAGGTSPPPTNWSVAMDYAQFGGFSSGVKNGSSLTDQYGVTLNGSGSSHTSYNLLTVHLSADGSASVTTDLNGNDASLTNTLIGGQLNGVLMLNGLQVTAQQATAALLTHYNAATGWNLNPNGYTIDSFQPDDPTHTASVFSLSTTLFLDPAVTGVTVSTLNASKAIAVTSVPEPDAVAMALGGLGLLLAIGRIKRA
ncbi:MAG: hypothetical protein QM749_07255 [Aquabacterium sp.]